MNIHSLSLVLVFIFLVGCTSPQTVTFSTENGVSPPGTVEQQAPVQQETQQSAPVQQSAQKILIEYSATKQNTIGEYNQAEDGMTYLVLDMTISNNGYKEFGTNPFYFSVIVDNVKYDSSWATIENSLGTKTIMNGGKLGGKMVFEVPQNTAQFEIVYDSFVNEYNIEYVQK